MARAAQVSENQAAAAFPRRGQQAGDPRLGALPRCGRAGVGAAPALGPTRAGPGFRAGLPAAGPARAPSLLAGSQARPSAAAPSPRGPL